jgi:hypothetical protein
MYSTITSDKHDLINLNVEEDGVPLALSYRQFGKTPRPFPGLIETWSEWAGMSKPPVDVSQNHVRIRYHIPSQQLIYCFPNPRQSF